jgi:hypothetical protein
MVTLEGLHVVIPTIRLGRAAWLVNALHQDSGVPWKNFHVVHDSPVSPVNSAFNRNVNLYSRADYPLGLPIFSKKDSSCRSLGFWKAWTDPTCEAVLTIDDDCVPVDADFVSDHIDNLNTPVLEERWSATIHPIHGRGLPYRARSSPAKIDVSHGGVLGVPDLSGPDQLVLGDSPAFSAPHFVVPRGNYYPMCGMNLAFTRRMIPLMYFAPGGEDQPLGRWDDIWCGVVAKKLMDLRDYRVHCGYPLVRHERASDPFVNLMKEGPGFAANENFWQFIDRFQFSLHDAYYTPLELLMRYMGVYIAGQYPEHSPLPEYFREYGRRIIRWCDLLDRNTPR